MTSDITLYSREGSSAGRDTSIKIDSSLGERVPAWVTEGAQCHQLLRDRLLDSRVPSEKAPQPERTCTPAGSLKPDVFKD